MSQRPELRTSSAPFGGKSSRPSGGLDALTTPDPPVEPLDRPTSPDVALPQHLDGRVVGEDEHGAAAVASPPSARTPLLRQQSEASSSVLEEGEWEIRKIVSKRRAGKSYGVQGALEG